MDGGQRRAKARAGKGNKTLKSLSVPRATLYAIISLFFVKRNGHLLVFGGTEPLLGWFRALLQSKFKFKCAFAFVKEDTNCQDALWQ